MLNTFWYVGGGGVTVTWNWSIELKGDTTACGFSATDGTPFGDMQIRRFANADWAECKALDNSDIVIKFVNDIDPDNWGLLVLGINNERYLSIYSVAGGTGYLLQASDWMRDWIYGHDGDTVPVETIEFPIAINIATVGNAVGYIDGVQGTIEGTMPDGTHIHTMVMPDVSVDYSFTVKFGITGNEQYQGQASLNIKLGSSFGAQLDWDAGSSSYKSQSSWDYVYDKFNGRDGRKFPFEILTYSNVLTADNGEILLDDNHEEILCC